MRSTFLPWLAQPATEADFEALYREELAKIYNFFRYHAGEHFAEDLTSETVERAWRSRDRYRRDMAAFTTWLYSIARRVAADHHRRQRRLPATMALEDAVDRPAVERTDEQAERALDFERLSALLSRLPDRDRELVALRYGAGLTNRAIARLTGLSESNVGTILHRVVQKLRTELETLR